MREVHGICWPRTATVGTITAASDLMRGEFAAMQGEDAIVACELVPAGKYRNGAPRAWCRTHQTYWGVNADLAALAHTGLRRCARHAEPMCYALDPPRLSVAAHPGVVIRCAGADRVKVNVLEGKSAAVAIDVAGAGVFAAAGIVRVTITPPAVQAYVEARRSGQPLGCVDCARCGHPHLDLGDFARAMHRRHYCGNCGNDSTHSAAAIVSSPLHALCAAYGSRLSFI